MKLRVTIGAVYDGFVLKGAIRPAERDIRNSRLGRSLS